MLQPDTEQGTQGLRERKKALTRAAIEDAALKLFLEKGYDQTTVEELAELVMISPRTFFRYFASKEEVVFGWIREVAGEAGDLLARRPPDEPVLDSLRHVLDTLIPMFVEQRDRQLARLRLVLMTPSLAPGFMQTMMSFERVFTEFAAPRMAGGARDRRGRLLAAGVVVAIRVANEAWLESGGTEDLPTLVTENVELLLGGLWQQPDS